MIAFEKNTKYVVVCRSKTCHYLEYNNCKRYCVVEFFGEYENNRVDWRALVINDNMLCRNDTDARKNDTFYISKANPEDKGDLEYFAI